MSNPYETKSYEQLRKEVTERILGQGGTPLDVAVELFRLRHDPAAKVPGYSGKERKTVVIKEGPENTKSPDVSLDGTTVVITTRNARGRGLENVAVGEVWSEQGELPAGLAGGDAAAAPAQLTGRSIDGTALGDTAAQQEGAPPPEDPAELNSDNSTISPGVTAPPPSRPQAPARPAPAARSVPAAPPRHNPGPRRPSAGGLGL